MPKAEQVWISKTQSSREIVVLALFKSPVDGTFQFRTIGHSALGQLGQGKDVKDSNQMRLVDFQGLKITSVD